jgi:hypothetical protein
MDSASLEEFADKAVTMASMGMAAGGPTQAAATGAQECRRGDPREAEAAILAHREVSTRPALETCTWTHGLPKDEHTAGHVHL